MTVEQIYNCMDSTEKEKLRELAFRDVCKSRRDAIDNASLMCKTELDDMEASIPILLRQISDAFEMLYESADSLLDGGHGIAVSVSSNGASLSLLHTGGIVFIKDVRVSYHDGMFDFNKKATIRMQYETCYAMIDFIEDNSSILMKAIDETVRDVVRQRAEQDRPSKKQCYKVR